ncbi:MAG TPA: FAD binding domain-containing protein [Anaerolineaceae bacterium]|nr:FAD binding domain-containing protein [Anaerolineaceae bacterium]
MWKKYHIIENQDELKQILAESGPNARMIAGGTDLMVEIRNGKWDGLEELIDITRMAGSSEIFQDAEGRIHLGCLVTHNDVIASSLLRQKAFPLYQACWHVATPQIRNTATVAGNLVTASPANDTICPLMALDAELLLSSLSGDRLVALKDFYLGVRKTVLKPGEFLKEIIFTPLGMNEHGNFKKSGLRRAQVIATLNACVILQLNGTEVQSAKITLGAVAPTIIHAPEAEAFLVGKQLDKNTVQEAGKLAAESAKPISDIRASDAYRSYMVAVLVENALTEIAEGNLENIPENPATLSTRKSLPEHPAEGWTGASLQTEINGEHFVLEAWSGGRNLLDFIRDKVGLTGTKSGCEEGECGACTLFLDDKAVLSCLTPWQRAHNARIRTIEGVAVGGKLHPVQQAFIDHGAVQCGYCTPGFIMSSVKLLEECEQPQTDVIKQGLSGNLCRCTGYYKIVEAVEDAAGKMGR